MSDIKISIKDATVLVKKLALLFVIPTVNEAWIPHFLNFCKGLEFAHDVKNDGVQICIETAKFFRDVLDERIVTHPNEKDEFFLELVNLKDAIEQGEKRKNEKKLKNTYVQIELSDAEILDDILWDAIDKKISTDYFLVERYLDFRAARIAANFRRIGKEEKVRKFVPITEINADKKIKSLAGKTFVRVNVKLAKTIQKTLNLYLVCYPNEKSRFFAQLTRLENSIKMAEKRQEKKEKK